MKFSPRKTALALAVAVVCAWQSPVFAHGSEAHMVPLDKNAAGIRRRCAVG
ncbi:Monoamine oxidase [Klebsiella pneumoniae IS53]|nr:Monoamine oxidase [Klebsiella pneumoniae IS53]